MIYVGSFKECPVYVSEIPEELRLAHPRDFSKIWEKYSDGNYWTNNLLIVDLVPHKEVIVCNNGRSKTLSEHPQFHKWKEEFTAGEMWSIFGEDWV